MWVCVQVLQWKQEGFGCDFRTGSETMNDVNTDICGYIRDGADVFIDNSDLIWFLMQKKNHYSLMMHIIYNMSTTAFLITIVMWKCQLFSFFCAVKHWICKSESVKLHPVAVLICSTFWIRFVFECSTRIRICPSFDCEKWCLVVLLLLMHCCDKCTLEMLAM